MNETEKQTNVPFPAEDVSALIRLLGQVLVNADLYGLDHKITDQTLVSAYQALQRVHETVSRVRLALNEGDLSINGTVLPLKNPLMMGFAERMRVMNISGFGLVQGMSADEFSTLVRMLSTRGAGTDGASFAQQLAEQNLEHVETTTTVLREVQENEVVVDRDALEQAGEGDAEADRHAVEQITAFLKGEVPEADALKDLDEVASDPSALASLIMESAVVQQRQSIAGGELLGDIVVGCLRRAFSQLSCSQNMKTKKGRRQVAKMLSVIENDLLDRLRDYSHAEETASMQVEQAAEEMREELKVDDVVTDYLKRRSALEDSEKSLRRVGERVGEERLKELGVGERFSEAGVPQSSWRKLVVRTSQQGEASGADSLATMLNDLSSLLDRIESDPDMGSKVSSTLAEMGNAVDAAAESAEAKLENLEAVKESHADADKGRAEAWKLLPEIIQELCQPLSVVNGALDMVVSRRLGNLPDLVGETLEMALSSGRRMQGIASRLLDVCGVPDTLEPDPKACVRSTP